MSFHEDPERFRSPLRPESSDEVILRMIRSVPACVDQSNAYSSKTSGDGGFSDGECETRRLELSYADFDRITHANCLMQDVIASNPSKVYIEVPWPRQLRGALHQEFRRWGLSGGQVEKIFQTSDENDGVPELYVVLLAWHKVGKVFSGAVSERERMNRRLDVERSSEDETQRRLMVLFILVTSHRGSFRPGRRSPTLPKPSTCCISGILISLQMASAKFSTCRIITKQPWHPRAMRN
ncbi:hypothetical protein BJ322DRAFT_473093 [Thelephora terrestris]|uniref:Uncharacterized protein n=1 Tax=Thelephora terrestris TaxID=56493 RepID=A0A9P6H3U4_9AGAM|nr:hypothetical protein BJ322DRAFT_473093 [Thelephora terrestris]